MISTGVTKQVNVIAFWPRGTQLVRHFAKLIADETEKWANMDNYSDAKPN